ncbi:histidinolphosphatase [Haplosporangium sp. Z 11]|nr:histidinolphosphatase [Haplosporangium sp. Z 11]
MFSFHSHSGQFCMHAKGTLEQVVQSAIQRQFSIYGLSEHMPRYKPEQLYPEESHLTVQDLENMYDQFLQEAQRLQLKYTDKICLLIGLETEFFDTHSIDLVRRLREPQRKCLATTAGATTKEIVLPQVQYIVGSLHHIHGIPLDFSQELYLHALDVVGQGSWETLFREYFNAQFEMLQGLQPEVVGHLDLVRIFFSSIKGCHHRHSSGDKHEHEHKQEQRQDQNQNQNQLTQKLWALIKRNVDYVIAYGGLFELNSRAWKKGLADAYPQRDILEYILSKNGRVTLSDDSHGPDDVGMFYNPELKQYLELMNIERLYYLVPNGTAEDKATHPERVHVTNASIDTDSFQHVHVRSIPLASLNFYQK